MGKPLLRPIFVMKRKGLHQTFGRGCLIDFEAYFNTCMLLHDDVLLPLLVLLKDHLEATQVCLGEIERWISMPREAIEFLESSFGCVVLKYQDGQVQSMNTILKRVPISGSIDMTFNLSDEIGRAQPLNKSTRWNFLRSLRILFWPSVSPGSLTRKSSSRRRS